MPLGAIQAEFRGLFLLFFTTCSRCIGLWISLLNDGLECVEPRIGDSVSLRGTGRRGRRGAILVGIARREA